MSTSIIIDLYQGKDTLESLTADIGTCMLSCGWTNEDSPRTVFPNMVGKPRMDLLMLGLSDRTHYVGDEAQTMRSHLALNYSMKRGVVQDWDAMEKVLQQTFFSDLHVDPEQHPFNFTEALHNPKSNREKMAQLLFETFRVPAIKISTPPICIQMSTGGYSLFAVSLGEGVLQGGPAQYQGFGSSWKSQFRRNFASGDITDYLAQLTDDGWNLMETTAGREILRDIKEKLCYVAPNYANEVEDARTTNALRKNYELPDGTTITLNEERFKAPEALFQPSMMGSEIPGIHQLIVNAINQCPIEQRRDLFSFIAVTGGGSLMDRFPERLQNEISQLVPRNIKVRVVAAGERRYSQWIGATAVGSYTNFNRNWFAKELYEEWGPSIIHKYVL